MYQVMTCDSNLSVIFSTVVDPPHITKPSQPIMRMRTEPEEAADTVYKDECSNKFLFSFKYFIVWAFNNFSSFSFLCLLRRKVSNRFLQHGNYEFAWLLNYLFYYLQALENLPLSFFFSFLWSTLVYWNWNLQHLCHPVCTVWNMGCRCQDDLTHSTLTPRIHHWSPHLCPAPAEDLLYSGLWYWNIAWLTTEL